VEHRLLGRSGFKVSSLTYGNWVTHGSQIEDEAATACVRAALECGITSFDTADVYARGRAEEILGRALRGEPRDGVEVFTKVYGPMGDRPNQVGLTRKHIRDGIDASLRRLQLEYVDLYQAHRYDHETPLEETMQAFADVVRAGKALYIGVSEWRAEQIREAKALADDLRVPLVSNQPQYSALYRVIEAEVLPTCRELGLSQVVWSPLAQGVLTGKYQPGQARPEGSRGTDERGGGARFIEGLLREEVLQRVQELRPIAAEAGLSMAGLALAWVLAEDNVASAIIGASRPEQVRENVEAVGARLHPALKQNVDQVLAPVAQTDPALTQSPNPRG
jgi:aryl-alcohol dehydrogenase-like predicted oxidoreductase